ncbi:MAG: hypothetical protein V4636_10005 [Pseudomonadota bacterium]
MQDPSGDRIGYQGPHVTRTVTGELGGVPIWGAAGTGAVQNDIYASPGTDAADVSLTDAVRILGLDGTDAPTEQEVAFRLGRHICNAPEFAALRNELGNYAKAGLAAGVSMAAAHKTEVELLKKFATNPVMRSIAVAWPYVFIVVAEAVIKSVTNYQHPDPGAKVLPPVAPAMIAAVVNWNHVQGLIDTKLAGNNYLNMTKVGASALIAIIRGMVEHGILARAIAMLENREDAPQAYRPLSVQETVVLNALVTLLRGVGGDLIRQLKKGLEKEIEQTKALGTDAAKSTVDRLTADLPRASSTAMERVIHHPFYAGGTPAALGPVAALAKLEAAKPTQREDDPTVQGNAAHGLNPQSAFNPFA